MEEILILSCNKDYSKIINVFYGENYRLEVRIDKYTFKITSEKTPQKFVTFEKL